MDKQRDLLLKVTEEHRLNKQAVDDVAHERFGKGVEQLSTLETSGLLDELLESSGGHSGSRAPANGNGRRPAYARTGGLR